MEWENVGNITAEWLKWRARERKARARESVELGDPHRHENQGRQKVTNTWNPLLQGVVMGISGDCQTIHGGQIPHTSTLSFWKKERRGQVSAWPANANCYSITTKAKREKHLGCFVFGPSRFLKLHCHSLLVVLGQGGEKPTNSHPPHSPLLPMSLVCWCLDW